MSLSHFIATLGLIAGLVFFLLRYFRIYREGVVYLRRAPQWLLVQVSLKSPIQGKALHSSTRANKVLYVLLKLVKVHIFTEH